MRRMEFGVRVFLYSWGLTTSGGYCDLLGSSAAPAPGVFCPRGNWPTAIQRREWHMEEVRACPLVERLRAIEEREREIERGLERFRYRSPKNPLELLEWADGKRMLSVLAELRADIAEKIRN